MLPYFLWNQLNPHNIYLQTPQDLQIVYSNFLSFHLPIPTISFVVIFVLFHLEIDISPSDLPLLQQHMVEHL